LVKRPYYSPKLKRDEKQIQVPEIPNRVLISTNSRQIAENQVNQGTGKSPNQGVKPFPDRNNMGNAGKPRKHRPRFEGTARKDDVREAYEQLVYALRQGQSWAIIYFLDQYFGKARQRAEITGEDGGAIEIAEAKRSIENKLGALIVSNSGISEGSDLDSSGADSGEVVQVEAEEIAPNAPEIRQNTLDDQTA